MKVLIGYDGSEIAQNALEDLPHAGLPDDAELDVISVAESRTGKSNAALAQARYAKDRIAERFHFNNVNAEAADGWPAYEILNRSRSLGADLIMLGEERVKFDEHRMFLRNTTETVLIEAECSIRISRGNPERADGSYRVLIAYDGSPGSVAAVRTVSARTWPSRTQIKLLLVADTAVLSSIGRFAPQMTDPFLEAKITAQWARSLAMVPLEMLADAGLEAELAVEAGNPKNAIVDFARAWNADSIFVGPHCRGNSFERFLVGSVSSAVAARAHCSVEVVRGPTDLSPV